MKTKEQIFDEIAKENMFHWNLKEFKLKYKKLYETIMLSMEEYNKLNKPDDEYNR